MRRYHRAMFAKAIVRPPAQNFGEGLTTAGLGAPDYRRALKQHEAYCAALERFGLAVIRLDADPNYPDSCFVEDTAVIGSHAGEGAGVPMAAHVVITRPGAASRLGEVVQMSSALRQILPEFALAQIQSPGTLDGGDVCEAGEHYFIGLSARTNESGAQQLAQIVAAHGCTSSFVDIRGSDSLLHLKSGLAYLGDNRVVVIESLAGLQELANYEVVLVPPGADYAANCVRVNDYVLVAAGYDQFEQTLRRIGHSTVALDMTEFQKMDGGLSCLSLRW